MYSIGGLVGKGGGGPSLILSVGDLGPIAFAFPALTVGSRTNGESGGLLDGAVEMEESVR